MQSLKLDLCRQIFFFLILFIFVMFSFRRLFQLEFLSWFCCFCCVVLRFSQKWFSQCAIKFQFKSRQFQCNRYRQACVKHRETFSIKIYWHNFHRIILAACFAWDKKNETNSTENTIHTHTHTNKLTDRQTDTEDGFSWKLCSSSICHFSFSLSHCLSLSRIKYRRHETHHAWFVEMPSPPFF